MDSGKGTKYPALLQFIYVYDDFCADAFSACGWLFYGVFSFFRKA